MSTAFCKAAGFPSYNFVVVNCSRLFRTNGAHRTYLGTFPAIDTIVTVYVVAIFSLMYCTDWTLKLFHTITATDASVVNEIRISGRFFSAVRFFLLAGGEYEALSDYECAGAHC